MSVSRAVKTEWRVKQFAKRYVENGMNGTKTVKELYHPKAEGTAWNMAGEIVRKPQVQLAIAEQLEQQGLTDEHLDRELYRITKQNRVLPSKLSAIVEANKMKSRYPKDTPTHQHLHIQGVDNSNIDSKLEEILAELKELSQ